mmetsp:Transcript_10891/g.36089  ORF Transcript_10891/g.36089 Transcript_10891/m.36089 type:complete len:250 (+) Transcript_10891:102-851(+)
MVGRNAGSCVVRVRATCSLHHCRPAQTSKRQQSYTCGINARIAQTNSCAMSLKYSSARPRHECIHGTKQEFQQPLRVQERALRSSASYCLCRRSFLIERPAQLISAKRVWFLNVPLEPVERGALTIDLLLQLQKPVNQGFGRRRAARHVDVHWDDAVAAPYHGVRVMVVAAAVGAGAHRQDVTRLRHLVVDLPQCRGHLVGERPRNDHHVGLARRCTEQNAETIHVVSSGSRVHHLHSATGEPKRHRPH